MSPQQRAAFVARTLGSAKDRPTLFGPGTPTRVIAITSGKGGVGKSTITANLAVACAQKGLRVGIIDADVHGFSIPSIIGIGGPAAVRPTRIDTMIIPPVAHGVKVISIGMFLDPTAIRGQAVAWRGPMLHRTLQQFLRDVHFGDLDILLLDMPPGTGDVAISLGQLLPNAEVVVVTTPQPAATDVAERSGTLARSTGQRVIGVIENMSGSLVPDGPNLFGAGGGTLLAERLSDSDQKVPFLGSVPLSATLRQAADEGNPAVLVHPNDPASIAISGIATTLVSHKPRKTLPLRVRS